MKLYICVLDEVPDYIVPTLVAHTILNAHRIFSTTDSYNKWLMTSFKKCVVKVNRKEFNKIADLPATYLGYENRTLGGEFSCAVPLPVDEMSLPNVLKFAKLWAPRNE